MAERPAVLFACVRNAGRSQMAAAFFRQLCGDRAAIASAGSQPAEEVDPTVARAMAELGIEIGAATPRALTPEDVRRADVVVTMGCGESCPVFPGKRYEDWAVEDPAGKDLPAVRAIRADVQARVRRLASDLGLLA